MAVINQPRMLCITHASIRHSPTIHPLKVLTAHYTRHLTPYVHTVHSCPPSSAQPYALLPIHIAHDPLKRPEKRSKSAANSRPLAALAPRQVLVPVYGCSLPLHKQPCAGQRGDFRCMSRAGQIVCCESMWMFVHR